MNALVRTAVEEYGKKIDPNRNFGNFITNYDTIIKNYRMRYDKDVNHELDVLNINRHLRNHYLHYLPAEKPNWKTNNDHRAILASRVWFSSRGENVIFCENVEVEACKLLDHEKDIYRSCHIPKYYYAELLTWRIKNLIEEIDSKR